MVGHIISQADTRVIDAIHDIVLIHGHMLTTDRCHEGALTTSISVAPSGGPSVNYYSADMFINSYRLRKIPMVWNSATTLNDRPHL